MISRPLTLLLIGAGFAGGMTVAMSCNIGRSTTVHNAYDQGQGQKHEAKEHDDEEDDEVPINFADAPEPVRTAILKLTPEYSIKKLTREEDDHRVVFEVNYDSNGAKSSAEITEQGVVMELEKSVATSELPRAAADAIAKHFPNATVKSVTSVQQFLYEANVEVDGRMHEVKVNAAGKIQHKK
jgi:hypothetical protein